MQGVREFFVFYSRKNLKAGNSVTNSGYQTIVGLSIIKKYFQKYAKVGSSMYTCLCSLFIHLMSKTK